MKRIALLPLALGALALATHRAGAQAANTCNLVSQQGNYTVIGPENTRVISAQGPLLVRCANGEELRADSAILYQAQNEVHLFRRVDYEDPTRSLTSDQATYNSQTGRLYATGNVVFTDKQRGSVLRGPELEYYRAIPGRPEAQMTAQQRPHVTVRPKSGAGTTTRRDPMEIDGDRVTMLGDRYMTATGNVVIVDNGTRSTTDEAYYDQVADHVELRRNAKVDNEKYHLVGDFIATDLKNGSVSKVLAQNNARMTTDRLTVTGPQLQLFFERDLLQRMVSGQVSGANARPGAAPAASTPSTSPAADSAHGAATTTAAGDTTRAAAGQRPLGPRQTRMPTRAAPGSATTLPPAGTSPNAPAASGDTAARPSAATASAPRDTAAHAAVAHDTAAHAQGRTAAAPSRTGSAPASRGRAGTGANAAAGRRGGTGAAANGGSPADTTHVDVPRSTLAPELRSVAVSKGFRMEADSLEAILPDQQLKRVNAVGAAHGESWDTLSARTLQVDSGGHQQTVTATPRPNTEAPQALDQKDVLIADTIIAFFHTDSARADSARAARGRGADTVHLAGRPAGATAATPSPAGGRGTAARGDSARGDTARTEIQRLLALGDAHSLYRMKGDTTKGGQANGPKRPGLNYLVGDRIDLTFKNGEVDVAHVGGLKQGMYLDPTPPRDTAATDSAAARRNGAAGGRRRNTGTNGSSARGAPGASPGTGGAPVKSGTGSAPAGTPTPPGTPPTPRPSSSPQAAVERRGARGAAPNPPAEGRTS